MKTNKTLSDLFSFPGFRARSKLKGVFGDSPARIVTLVRRQKKRRVPHVARPGGASMTAEPTRSATWTRAVPGFTSHSSIAGWSAEGVAA
jgi:hypothetical protein